ncbi:universal stress protein [Streptomyces gardneri]|uniref:universal stress protein n=1 Tax=Nocardia TaxID=1817 RepID=UPI0013571EBC|nr:MULTISPECIES: universal stress protein [Nocardia]MBF6168055.1 universal stress protein [Streptomyces gardneri]MBF6206834.1 universal stress protein [Streptomyces gardneri]
MFQRIVVGYDDSPGARAALTMALDLAAVQHCTLTVVAVEEHLPHYGPVVGEMEDERSLGERTCRRWLATAAEAADRRGIVVRAELRAGQAARELATAAADHDADLLVVGRSGHSGIWGRFMGSTAEKAARHVGCSVLVAHDGAGQAGDR